MNYFWLSLALVTACSDEALIEEDPLPTPEPDRGDGSIRVGGDELQGRSLLGNFADTFSPTTGFVYAKSTGATLGSGAAVTVHVLKGKLQALYATTGAVVPASQLAGMQMQTQGTGWLVLKSIDTSDPTRERYVLDYKPTSAAQPTAYCDSAGLGASAVQGEWTRQRERILSNKISFACVKRGVADKCIKFGYDPDTMFDAYQACTQAASATYCWDGVPHTYDETPIRIRDYIAGAKDAPEAEPKLVQAPLSPWPPSPDTMYFESAWRPRQPVVCLSAVRWESLRPGPGCSGAPNALPDPRIEGTGGGGRFCEDYTYADLLAQDPNTIFVGSKAMDMGIYRWSSPAGAQVATARGYATDIDFKTIASEQVALKTAPFTGYSTLNEFDGFLLRNLPGTVSTSSMVPLYVHRKIVDTVLVDVVIANATVIPEHGRQEFEGWIFKTSAPNRRAFNLYRRGDDWSSGTQPPPGGGWAPVGAPMGYVYVP